MYLILLRLGFMTIVSGFLLTYNLQTHSANILRDLKS